MDWLPIAVLVFGIPIGLAIWLIARAVQASRRVDELSQRVGELESQVILLKKEPRPAHAAESTPAPGPITPIATATPQKPAFTTVLPQSVPPPQTPPVTKPVPPPPIDVAPRPQIKPAPTVNWEQILGVKPGPQTKTTPAINWEQFMGVKLFAWIGGLALFLGVAFFVKYSFDNNLVPPELRVAIGFVVGVGLLVGGVLMSRRNYSALSQTLCATGVVILYAVTFSCRSVYHFAFFSQITAFIVMIVITATAFLLAVRLNALVVAILGMLGGFLTPILLSTGQDNPLGLFGYIAILDAGLIVVALNRRWFFLMALAAAGTAFMQIGWAGEFFESQRYFAGNKIFIALGVLLGFNALFLAATGWAKRRQQFNWWLAGGAFGLAVVAFGFAGWFLTFETLAQRPWLLFGFVFLIDLIVAALAWLDNEVANAQPVAGLIVFGLLAFWTKESLTNELLNAALVFYFTLAVFHSVFPVLLQRRRGATAPLWGSRVFPPLALVLVLLPIFQLAEISFVVWPFVLLVDVLAIGLAVLTLSLFSVLGVLLLTLVVTGVLIFKIPAELTGLPTSLFVLGAFAVFFVATGLWLARKFKPDVFTQGIKLSDDYSTPANVAAQLPLFSVTMPFLLLIMATLRLPLTDPSPVFGLALLVVVLLLGVTKLFSLDWLPAVGLACVIALECAWHFNHYEAMKWNVPPQLPLMWYLIFFAVFALFPFLFLRKFADKVVPWAVAAMAGPPQFFLIHRVVKAAYPNEVMGLLPAAFAIPALLSLAVVLKKIPSDNKARLTQLAWFGGVALFFITLIFPIQFERQWITLGWALEGAALLWLFHRVPHPGLRFTGFGLLVAAFVRLALNPAVLDYHPRSATPILNWYLYAYGIATVCLFVGARLLAPPRNLILRSSAPPILAGLGTVLAFLLLNIEIADLFSDPGSTLTFQFSGNFARDMTYSIAWALFALVLLIVGIWKKTPATRYAALGLLSVTVLKLFFHDLARLNQLYRIGALIGVAVIAMLASFAYQRFFAASSREKEAKNEAAQ